MKQVSTDNELFKMIELSIETKDVFSEDFKHYAKMLYLGCVARTIVPGIITAGSDTNGQLEPGKLGLSHKETVADVAAKLCHVAANAVTERIHAITEELSDEDKLNDALAELFGDMWDKEKRCFIKKEK